METPTPFDLNQAIQRWRDNLEQTPAFRTENLNELESHLRDSIATLQSKQLSTEETFLLATRRVGNTAALEAEFGKYNSSALWLDRALWIFVGVQFWLVAANASTCLRFLTNIFLPKVNEWLVTYGFGQIPESVPVTVFGVVTMPLTIIAAVKACSLFQRWAEKRGWSPFSYTLNRPRLLAGIYCLLCLSEFAFMFGSGWLVNKFGSRALSFPSQSTYTTIALITLQAILLAALVMVIARRRLRLNYN
jgi:hypothetical protein